VSLTGDPLTDTLVPVALQLIGAVRAGDSDAVAEAFAAAILATGGRCDPGEALAVVCAALVPDESTPSELLGWYRVTAEYERLLGNGVDPTIAGELSGWKNRTAA
jgi:hypothetical protein